MNIQEINNTLLTLLGSELDDWWEREELVGKISSMPESLQEQVLQHLPVIWPVSYALFMSFVDLATTAGRCLQTAQFTAWVHATLDVYEADGLHQAQIFMQEVESNFVCRLRGEDGVRLSEVEGRLLPYARGLLGRDISLSPASETGFDSETIFLPSEINIFQDRRLNFLLFKFSVTFLLSLERYATFTLDESDLQANPLQQFVDDFAHPALAAELLYLAEGVRVLAAMQQEYVGLMADCREVFAQLIQQESAAPASMNTTVAGVRQWLLAKAFDPVATNYQGASLSSDLYNLLAGHYERGSGVKQSMALAVTLYAEAEKLAGRFTTDPPNSKTSSPHVVIGNHLPFMGELMFAAVYENLRQRRAILRQKFVEALAAVLPKQIMPVDDQQEQGQGKAEKSVNRQHMEEGLMLLIEAAMDSKNKQAAEQDEVQAAVMVLGDAGFELPEELIVQAQEISREQGEVPFDYIVSAVGQAGSGLSLSHEVEAQESGEEAVGPLLYDEWDYRRSGFRKNWCHVLLKDVDPIKGTFVSNTLHKYKGLLSNLRRQFEMMSVQERFVKRQRDGDEIDLEAVIDSVADYRAGLAPSERLFVRRQRDSRNIAALFLVDMSSSTEGWVGTAIKESLILMCESLSVLGDRYAIYGFSGMRRTRSEIFQVKSFSEPYDETIKDKIAAISPKEYTRMGPALRHATKIISETEAGIRLLITLTDGKPEDYDDYKGVYAIEDTRHALIEAKAAGVHPFCITVDRQAHDYMAHMYGEVNYIFIDEVRKLPNRMPEIYRNLTT